MIYVFMLACLISNPSDCRNVKLTFESDKQLTPQQCMQNGQIEMVKWFEEHPNYVIKKWKCSDRNEEDL